MEVIVHGTKGGYKILYQSQNVPRSIARDVRRIDRNDGSSVGKYAYSISFADSGCVFTKYLIVRDIERRAVGNVAFSVYVDSTNKLSGEAVKRLLDELIAHYKNNYTQDGNLGIVNEDWTFVDDLINKYTKKLTPNYSKTQSQGNEEAAYIYYKNEEELEKYFDAPYHVKYFSFKQVFFVTEQLKESSQNPLTALSHNTEQNLTGIIDFKNPSYVLKGFSDRHISGVTIEIWVNHRKISNNDTIRKNDTIRVKYTKNFHESIEENGQLNDPKIQKYLAIDNDSIKVNQNVQLLPETKTIKLQVINKKNKIINDTTLQCIDHKNNKREVHEDTLVFRGNELGEQWIIKAHKGNKYSKDRQFIPSQVQDILHITLEDYIEVEFKVIEANSEESIYNFKLDVVGKDEHVNESKIGFIGSEITETWEIIITKKGYREYRTHYYPDNYRKPLIVRLNRITNDVITTQDDSNKNFSKGYNIDSGEHGTLKNGSPEYSNRKDGSDITEYIKPNKGWIFERFELTNDILVAKYHQKKSIYNRLKFNKQIVMFIGCIIILASLVFFVSKILNRNTEQSDITKLKNEFNRIIAYCDGNILIVNDLSDFKNDNCDLDVDASILKLKEDACSKVENSLILIASINSGEIDELKTYKYSNEQQKFHNVIDSISPRITPTIKNYLIGLNLKSTLNLDELANSIEGKIKSLNIPSNDSIVTIERPEEEGKKEEPTKPLSNPQEEKNIIKKPSPDDLEIVKTFEDEFWDLVKKKGSAKKDEYTQLYNKYNVSSQHPIKSFLKEITLTSANFTPFRDILSLNRIKTTKNKDIDSLKELYDEQKK